MEPLHAFSPKHPDTATSLNNLAVFYQAQGDYEHALPLQQRALAVYEQVFGSLHPQIKTIRANYDELLKKIQSKTR